MRSVVLVTDFGTRDPYVAAMKGVIASRTDVPIVDLTHEIAPFAVFEAAWFLRDVVAHWRDAVFVCVVDPGVGTERKIVAMRSGTNVLLAPDNGLLTFLRGDTWSIENESLFLPNASTTFHGRDRFAPVAAGIANGMSLDDVGPRIDDVVRLPYEEPSYAADKVSGTIVRVDRFGNIITDIERAKVPFEIRGLRANYSGEGPFPIIGSTGCLEISMAGASAADDLHLRPLDRIELWPSRKGALTGDVEFSRASR